MSKIGKKHIVIPQGVDITINHNALIVKGPKGELSKTFPVGLSFRAENGMLITEKTESALWGLSRALAANMIKGVTEGFQKVLEFNGVGFKANVKDDSLELNLGFTNSVSIKAPSGIAFRVEKNSITVEGMDAETVGHIAAKIRAARPPEPYKGSGIAYRGEIIRRKAGKKAGATATTT